MPGQRDSAIKDALQINEMLASCFHFKNPHIARDEFVSVGFIGIAKANKRFVSGNWGGYVKIAIQNSMISLCREEKRKRKLMQKAYKVYAYNKYVFEQQAASERFLDCEFFKVLIHKNRR